MKKYLNKLNVAMLSLAFSAFLFSGCLANPQKQNQPARAPTPPPVKIAPKAKPAPAEAPKTVQAPAEKKATETTRATSAGLSKKIQMPEVLAAQTKYRPRVNIGKESVQGTGTASDEKLDAFSGCLENSIFVDPEIFNGLSEMQSIALREAIADACKKSGADFLVAPRYELSLSRKEDATGIVCTVSGYPATIVEFVEVTETSPELEAMKNALAAADAAMKQALAEKDKEILALGEKIKALQAEKPRSAVVAEYCEVVQKFDVADMNHVRRILALMGECPPVSEKDAVPEKPVASDENVLNVKAGDIVLQGNVGVTVPVEVPALKVKIEN